MAEIHQPNDGRIAGHGKIPRDGGEARDVPAGVSGHPSLQATRHVHALHKTDTGKQWRYWIKEKIIVRNLSGPSAGKLFKRPW